MDNRKFKIGLLFQINFHVQCLVLKNDQISVLKNKQISNHIKIVSVRE